MMDTRRGKYSCLKQTGVACETQFFFSTSQLCHETSLTECAATTRQLSCFMCHVFDQPFSEHAIPRREAAPVDVFSRVGRGPGEGSKWIV